MPSRLKRIFSGILLLILPVALHGPSVSADEIETDLPSLCGALDKAFQKRAWGKNPCGTLSWKFESTSVQGRPLIYLVFGPEDSKNTTLILSMVHGDEITPLYLGFQISQWAEENMSRYPKARLVIAPFINPDGFLGYPKTRTNAHGVDCNRNFSTRDWQKEALSQWKKRFHSDKRRFPGYKPDSEPERYRLPSPVSMVASPTPALPAPRMLRRYRCVVPTDARFRSVDFTVPVI